MPITAVSVAYDNWSLSLSGSPHTRFSNPDAPGGSVSRDEYDIALAYAVLNSPNSASRLSVLLDYKAGKSKPTASTSGTQLLGIQGESKLAGWLVGLSGVSPLGGTELLLYGNAAFGMGRAKYSSPLVPSNDLYYQIAEIGISYPLGGAFSIQFGYRVQNFTFRKVALQTLTASNPPALLSESHRDIQSTTQGVIMGISASF